MNPVQNDREAAARMRRAQRMAAAAAAIHAGYEATPQPVDPYLAVAEAIASPETYTPSDEHVPQFLRDSWRKING